MLQTLFVLLAPVWFFVAVGGTMSLAAWESPLATPVVYAFWSYPLVVLAAAATAWVLFATGALRAARWCNRMPVPWLVVSLAVLVWVATA